MENKKIPNRKLSEQHQSITKEHAVSYAIITLNYLYPDLNVENFGLEMIEIIRALKPKYAVKYADKLIQQENSKD